MSRNNFSHEQKDDLISTLKCALELACARLACYDGMGSPTTDPEEWLKRAYLMQQSTGWKRHD